MGKRILITNDDGYESVGLLALAEALMPLGQVFIVAPATEKSACAHSITVTKPLKFINVNDDFFKIDDGTPSDCIYLAMKTLFEKEKKPDLIVSGINLGANLGEDITYSGTAGGAMEGVLHGVPSFAISQYYKSRSDLDNFDFALAKQVAFDIASRILNDSFPLPPRHFINVNIPPIKPNLCNGYKITKAGNRNYDPNVLANKNPRGETYYWIGVESLSWQKDMNESSDIYALNDNFISLTPIKLDMTADEQLENMRKWLDND